MRITGGTYRSRAILAPRGSETRPTSDRVREALFSMLASSGVFADEPGPRVLDLYAGSGALALEALSRGARAAVLVESARPAVAAIRANIDALAVGDLTTVLAMRVEQALSQLDEPFDLVLLDPPYAVVDTPSFSELLANAAQHVAPEGLLVLEHAASSEPSAPQGLELDRSRRHGDTALSLFRASRPA
jgi:16S rRNA (guanine966-N2)-methyltransferase